MGNMEALIDPFLERGIIPGLLEELFQIRDHLSSEQKVCWRMWKDALTAWERAHPSRDDHATGGHGSSSRVQDRLRDRLMRNLGQPSAGSSRFHSPQNRRQGAGGPPSSPRRGGAGNQDQTPGRMASSSSSDRGGTAARPDSASHRAEAASRDKAMADLLVELDIEEAAKAKKTNKKAKKAVRKAQAASSRPSAAPPAAPIPITTPTPNACPRPSPRSSPRTAAWEALFTSRCEAALETSTQARTLVERSGYWVPYDQATTSVRAGVDNMRRVVDPVNQGDLESRFPPGITAHGALPQSTVRAMQAFADYQEAQVQLMAAQMLQSSANRMPDGLFDEQAAKLERMAAGVRELPWRPG